MRKLESNNIRPHEGRAREEGGWKEEEEEEGKGGGHMRDPC